MYEFSTSKIFKSCLDRLGKHLIMSCANLLFRCLLMFVCVLSMNAFAQEDLEQKLDFVIPSTKKTDFAVSVERELPVTASTALESVNTSQSKDTSGASNTGNKTANKITLSIKKTQNNLDDLIRTPGSKSETAGAMRIVLGLSFLAVFPAILVCLSSFLRIAIVLSMLRHAIGMQETPPNMVIIGLALFMTLFTMSPVIDKINGQAFQPFMENRISIEEGIQKAMLPLRDFMVAQTRESDIALMIELSHAPEPKIIDDVSNVQLIPAFMLSELRAAFQIGFMIFLPFLLIDLIVSSILMGLGMMMMPPTAIALPLKILMFVLVDGWSLVMRALVGSFH